jgi:hypothetical protein
MIQSIITATGSYIPELVIRNEDFLASRFFTKEGTAITQEPAAIVERFSALPAFMSGATPGPTNARRTWGCWPPSTR